jgi:hypothetical protein
MNESLSMLLSWLPFLLLIAVFFWYSREPACRRRGRSGISMIELYEQQVK